MEREFSIVASSPCRTRTLPVALPQTRVVPVPMRNPLPCSSGWGWWAPYHGGLGGGVSVWGTLTWSASLTTVPVRWGGDRGLEADQKVIAAHGCYAMTATTALTAQNTTGVDGIHHVPPEFVRKQIDAVFRDIQPDVVKTGQGRLCRDRLTTKLMVE